MYRFYYYGSIIITQLLPAALGGRARRVLGNTQVAHAVVW